MSFFRFYSIFGKKSIDKDALAACIKHKDGLRHIAIERVRDELFKLLATENVAPTLKIIYDHDILSYFLPKSQNLDALQRLTDMVHNAGYEGNFLRRLFVLYQPNSAQAESMAHVLRFTKKQKETFINWAKIELSLDNIATPDLRRKFIYRYGKQFCIDKILLTMAVKNIDTFNLYDVLREVENTEVPVFPLRGRDIINAGFAKNKTIGKILSALEQHWIDSDFRLTAEELLTALRNTALHD
jgi:tRNA nucleotidyltransferase/poly(A) polymerase